MTEPGDPTGGEALQRAPLAIAASLAVLAGGAMFLVFAMSRPTVPASVAPESAVSLAPQVTSLPAKAPPARRAAAAPLLPAAPPPAETIAAAFSPPPAIDDGIAAAFGGPLRVNPARIAAPSALARLPKPDASNGAGGIGETVLSLATQWVAQESDRPPPFFFESDLAAAMAAAPSARSTDGDIVEGPRDLLITLAKGETFVDAMRRAGVRADDRNEAAYAFGKLFNMRRLRPGQEFRLTVAEPYRTLYQDISAKERPPTYLLSLDFRADAENRIALTRSPDGRFAAKEFPTPLTTRIAAISGRIDGSLYVSAKRQGAPDEVIAGLAQMFAYDVDFQREMFGGDEFEALFEVRFDDSGRMVAGGDILFGRLKWRGRQKEKGYYRFEIIDGGRGDYFDASGESARRLLMKTPIDGARLSSGFGTRKHPILGYQKAHKGVDFAASRGTPIMAAGDGVIERAGPYGSFGNYVRIRHAQGYKTAYAHMNSIRKGIRTGVRVRQGDIIGTVGSTGRSTGPHLHYEVHLKDTPVNPQSLKIATGYELGGKELARFREIRDRIDAMRAPQPEEANLIAGANARDKAL
ncbi:MAG: peptidoglycan DD-metalloendopeptidase family protein [Pseudomonadota bacterium]